MQVSGPGQEVRRPRKKSPRWSAGRRACRSHGARRLHEVPDYEVAPFGAPLPHACEGKENDGGPRADQIAGAMNHVCRAEGCLKMESEMSTGSRNSATLPWRGRVGEASSAARCEPGWGDFLGVT